MSEIDFEEDGPRYMTLEDAKGIKQYERLKTAFMEDNNVLVHFGSYGLIFGESHSSNVNHRGTSWGKDVQVVNNFFL